MKQTSSQTNQAQAYDQFPKKAMVFYIGVILLSALTGLVTEGITADPESGMGMVAVVILVSLLIGGLGLFAVTVVQYALIKFPTQWIAKDEQVYTNDIWAALLYSNGIGMLLSVSTDLIGLGGNVIWAAVNSAVITGLFLYFYFYGTQKPVHVKRAIIIVQVLWLVFSLAFSVLTYQMT